MDNKRRLSKEFGIYIKDLRESRGLTIESASNYMGISTSYLNRLEKGLGFIPAASILKAIGEFYGKSSEELLQKTGNNSLDKYYNMQSLEKVIYKSEFILTSIKANRKEKDAIVSLVKCIVNLKWNDESRNRS